MLSEYQSDHCTTYEAADQIAGKIRRFWASKGVAVRVWVQREATPTHDMPLWSVRSDIKLSGRPA